MRDDDVSASVAVEDYLTTIEKALVGPRRWRSDVIAELRDGLAEAAEAHRRATGSPGDAAALAEFGPSHVVVAGFLAVGAASLGRRVVLGVLASGPVAATVWVAAMAASGIAPWLHDLAGPWRLLPGVGAVLAVAVPAALLVLAMTGRAGYRWGAARPQLVPAAAGLATGACAAGDAVLLSAVAVWLTGSTPATAWPLLAAVGFSGIRCLLAGWAAGRCLVARSRLA